MKCVATGKDTNMLTHNIPLSREGRNVITEKHLEYNNILKEKFITEQLELNNKNLTREHLEKLAPHINKSAFLRMVNNSSIDDMFKQLNNLDLEEKERKEENIQPNKRF
jgi:hypothetical protein